MSGDLKTGNYLQEVQRIHEWQVESLREEYKQRIRNLETELVFSQQELSQKIKNNKGF